MRTFFKFIFFAACGGILLFFTFEMVAAKPYVPGLNNGTMIITIGAMMGLALFGWGLIKASRALCRPGEDICHTCNQEFDNGYTLHCGMSSARICAECWSRTPDKHLLRKDEA